MLVAVEDGVPVGSGLGIIVGSPVSGVVAVGEGRFLIAWVAVAGGLDVGDGV